MSRFQWFYIRRWSSNQGIPGSSPFCCKLATGVPCRSQAEFRFGSPGFLYFPIKEWFNFSSAEYGVLDDSAVCPLVMIRNDVPDPVAGVDDPPCHGSLSITG
jgi:hypothetical protein